MLIAGGAAISHVTGAETDWKMVKGFSSWRGYSHLTAAIIFIMAALWNRTGHYIFALWFLLLSSIFFFPRLISAVAEWMSTTLLHMVWR